MLLHRDPKDVVRNSKDSKERGTGNNRVPRHRKGSTDTEPRKKGRKKGRRVYSSTGSTASTSSHSYTGGTTAPGRGGQATTGSGFKPPSVLNLQVGASAFKSGLYLTSYIRTHINEPDSDDVNPSALVYTGRRIEPLRQFMQASWKPIPISYSSTSSAANSDDENIGSGDGGANVAGKYDYEGSHDGAPNNSLALLAAARIMACDREANPDGDSAPGDENYSVSMKEIRTHEFHHYHGTRYKVGGKADNAFIVIIQGLQADRWTSITPPRGNKTKSANAAGSSDMRMGAGIDSNAQSTAIML